MPKQVKCPRCDKPLAERCLTDSEDRIYAKWRCCPCGYDTRTCPPEGIRPALTAAN